jgi:hypothetical protein
MAASFASIRLYMLYHLPVYGGALYGGWFDTLTLIFWPGSFYLTVMVAKASLSLAIFVWGIAILLNVPIYGIVGWGGWHLLRALNLIGRKASDE